MKRRTLIGLATSLFGSVSMPATATGHAPAGEKKLDEIVRIEAEGIPVADLLAALSAKSGVVLSSRGIVSDEKVVIFGPRRPLRETLADLAALLNASWKQERTSSGSTRYVLELGAAAQRHEQKLADIQLLELTRPVSGHIAALRESPEQLAKRAESDLTRSLLSDPQSRLAAELFALLAPSQLRHLYTRRRLNVPFTALTPEQQDGLRRIWGLVMDAETAFAASPEGMKSEPLTIRRKKEDVERGFLRIRVQRVGGCALVAMFAGGFPVASEAFSDNGKQNFSTSGWPIYVVQGEGLRNLPIHGNPYTGQTIEADPQIPTDAERSAARRGWIATLRGLAEKTGKPVVADFYRMPAINAPADPSPQPDRRAGVAQLDSLCQPFGYLWWQRGSTLLFRKRDWFEQRLFEVPDRWITGVVRELGSERLLTTRVLKLIGQLTPEQAAGLYSLRDLPSTEEPELLYPVRALLRIVEAGDPAGKRVIRQAPPTPAGEAPNLAPVLAAIRMSSLQQRMVPPYLAETDGMLGEQLPPTFRAWVSTGSNERTLGPDQLPTVDLEVRWSFEPAGRVSMLRIPLPTAIPAPHRSLRVEF